MLARVPDIKMVTRVPDTSSDEEISSGDDTKDICHSPPRETGISLGDDDDIVLPATPDPYRSRGRNYATNTGKGTNFQNDTIEV